MSEFLLRFWLACGIVFTAAVWAFTGNSAGVVSVVAGYFIVGAVALIALIWTAISQAERDDERRKKKVYYHILCKRYGYSGIMKSRNRNEH
jgi:hypothetical protein